ncbi:SDR family oxidoreductase [Candidatus Woesearchaeota archaeon]|nr:SDR family oxidoreductase [Candidatus Woesearchaeota archaeon]
MTDGLTALVTGAGGYVGSIAMRQLQESGKYAHVSGTMYRKHVDDADLMDITNRDQVFTVLREKRPDHVFHFAAISNVDYCEKDPDLAHSTNVEGVRNLVDACKEVGAKLVHVSTDYVFDDKSTRPYMEFDTARPLQVYGKTKHESEELVLNAGGIVVRSSGVVGYAGIHDDKFMKFLIKGGPQGMYNNGKKCFTFAPDLVAAMAALAEKGASGVYHVAGPEKLTWYEYASTIRDNIEESVLSRIPEHKQLKLFVKEPQAVNGHQVPRPEKVFLDTSKIRREFPDLKFHTAQEAALIMGEQIARDYDIQLLPV